MTTRRMADAFWRAGTYCLHPKIVALSLLPLALAVALALGLGWFFWEPAVAATRQWLTGWPTVDGALRWLEGTIGASFRGILAPLAVLLLAAPLVIVVSMLLVSMMMMPAIVSLVAARRFPALARRRGGGWFGSLLTGLACTVVALLLLLASMPLWLVPPLVLLLPPLIWGWLTSRVMRYDALAEHAGRDERRQLFAEHRAALLAMGVVCGFLGTAPAFVWSAIAAAPLLAPILVVASLWLSMLVFAFSALWFAHYLLSALADRRMLEAAAAASVPPAAAMSSSPGSGAPAGSVVAVDAWRAASPPGGVVAAAAWSPAPALPPARPRPDADVEDAVVRPPTLPPPGSR